jgi:hypothetical protein
MKTSFDADFKTNLEDAENGKWFTITGGVELKIRSANSKASEAVRRKLESGYRGKIPESVKRDITLRHIAQGLIVDWRGVEIDGELQTTYDAKKMEVILKEMPALIGVVADICSDVAAFQGDEDTEKN